jgi:hypothetical protein
MEFREKDLWTFLEDSSRESKSCSSSKIEKIQRPGGQQTLLRWGTASSGIRDDFRCRFQEKEIKETKELEVVLCV